MSIRLPASQSQRQTSQNRPAPWRFFRPFPSPHSRWKYPAGAIKLASKRVTSASFLALWQKQPQTRPKHRRHAFIFSVITPAVKQNIPCSNNSAPQRDIFQLLARSGFSTKAFAKAAGNRPPRQLPNSHNRFRTSWTNTKDDEIAFLGLLCSLANSSSKAASSEIK